MKGARGMRGTRESPADSGGRSALKRATPKLSARDSVLSSTARLQPFPIVGIGASAGGLEAFSTLLSTVPQKTGMAFVLVQHLDPSHESMLPSILLRRTTIPVTVVKDGMTIEPDRIYVGPANTVVELRDAALRLLPRPPQEHLPIDRFFRSLAAECREKAIGVVLSGAGFDGTEGCCAIKTAGGITIAQEAESAQVDGMPRNAINAGCVDLVLPPKAIARELAKFARDGHALRSSDGRQGTPGQPSHDELNRLFAMLLESTGVDFAHYKQDIFLRRLRRRMVIRCVPRVADYIEYARNTPGELDELYRDLLIHVTGFFRGPEMFEVFTKKVLPGLLKHGAKNDPLRIWIAGCSTGEEVYSFAIAFLEAMKSLELAEPSKAVRPLTAVQIFATDISEPALARARSGLYSETEVEGLSAERLQRFFTPSAGSYQISKLVREMCIFAKHNITRDPPFLNLDVISCRNLLIYLSPALQQRVIATFQYALKPKGYLVLGESEGLGALADRFTVVDKKQRIHQKSPSAPMAFPVLPGIASSSLSLDRGAPAEGSNLGKPPNDQVDQVLFKRFMPASIVVSPEMEILQFRGKIGPYLEPASGRPAFNLWKMVNQSLIPDLRAALNEAEKHNRAVRRERVRLLPQDGRFREIDLEAIPLSEPAQSRRRYVIVFQERVPAGISDRSRGSKASKRQSLWESENERLRAEVEHVRADLLSLSEAHDATLEEYKSANEEVLSSNEELQSTNEELETAKEELQSANEELATLNDELKERNTELSRANADLSNLIVNVKIPLMLVDGELRIRRFTPPAAKLLNLLPIESGQRLGEVRPNLDMDDLASSVREVIEAGGFREREVQEKGGPWHLMRVRPYKALDGRLDGAVITFQNIDFLKRSLDQTRHYADALIENAREPLLILDAALRVAAANRAFYKTFHVTREDAENHLIYELDHGQWNIPRLRELLVSVLSASETEEDFELQHEFPKIGMRVMLVNARRIEPESFTPLILLAIEDVTERNRALEALKRQARMFDLVHDAILLRDHDGVIRFWSHGAERMYGWTEREALGQLSHVLLHTSFPAPRREVEQEVLRTGRWEGELVHTRRDGSRIVVHSHWGLQQGSEFAPSLMLEVNADISGLKESEGSLRSLSRELIRAQDKERQRIAHELHDSTGQKLVALKMQLNAAAQRRPVLNANIARILSECLALTDEVMRDVRTLAYGLYPPMLEEAGLASAVRWFVEVFSRQTGLTVQLSVPSRLRRLPKESEIALFRVVQESLTNVLQHSGSRQASVALRQHGESEIVLEVRDEGQGRQGLRAGLGILGMRERMRQAGGRVEIESGAAGTIVRAILPIEVLQAVDEALGASARNDGGELALAAKAGPELDRKPAEASVRKNGHAAQDAKPEGRGAV
jgi:two-component system, chemotaxis family, CheB/CheR fusion protein